MMESQANISQSISPKHSIRETVDVSKGTRKMLGVHPPPNLCENKVLVKYHSKQCFVLAHCSKQKWFTRNKKNPTPPQPAHSGRFVQLCHFTPQKASKWIKWNLTPWQSLVLHLPLSTSLSVYLFPNRHLHYLKADWSFPGEAGGGTQHSFP